MAIVLIFSWFMLVQVQYEDVDDLAAVAADVDILYQTRIQKERFQVSAMFVVAKLQAAVRMKCVCQHQVCQV